MKKQYTKKQITEAIAYWKKQLNESHSDDPVVKIVAISQTGINSYDLIPPKLLKQFNIFTSKENEVYVNTRGESTDSADKLVIGLEYDQRSHTVILVCSDKFFVDGGVSYDRVYEYAAQHQARYFDYRDSGNDEITEKPPCDMVQAYSNRYDGESGVVFNFNYRFR